MRNRQLVSGFTLIELIIIILILAVLAVVATSRYVAFNREAEVTKAQQYAVAMQQAVNFAHTRWLLNGETGRGNNLVGYAGNQLDMNDNGYPLGTDKNSPMGQAFNIGKGNKACADLFEALLQDGPTVAHNNNNSDYRSYRHNRHGHKDTCTYVLRTLGDTGDQSTGEVRIVYDSVTGKVEFLQQ